MPTVSATSIAPGFSIPAQPVRSAPRTAHANHDAPLGYRWNHNRLAYVMGQFGIHDANALLRAAVVFDNGNHYLHACELQRAAELVTLHPLHGFRVNTTSLRKIEKAYHVPSAEALLAEAVKHDDGNRYLSKDELRVAAKALTHDREWTSSANTQLRKKTGSMRGHAWSPAVVDRVMKRFSIGNARRLILSAIRRGDGNRYLNTDDLVAGAWAKCLAIRDLQFARADVLGVMAEHDVESVAALVTRAHELGSGQEITRNQLVRAARSLQDVVDPNDVVEVSRRIEALSGREGVTVVELGRVQDHPIEAVRFTCEQPKLRIAVTAGVHGDEPAGMGAAMMLIEQFASHPELHDDIELTVVPLVNPLGMASGTRRTPDGTDINRECTDDDDAPTEVKALGALFSHQRFDLVLDLHGSKAKRSGFFSLHADCADLLEPALAAFAEHWPVPKKRLKSYQLTAPGVARSNHEGTLKDFAATHGARWTATLESPASLSYLDQVVGTHELVRQIIATAFARS